MIHIKTYESFYREDYSIDRGKFVAIGGSESENTIKYLIDIVGSGASVLLITTATAYKMDAERKYFGIFGGMGCKVDVVHAENSTEIDSDDNLKKLEGADLVFFCGGDQSRIGKCLPGTDFLVRMEEKIKEGLVVAGTSAGAMAFSEMMICGGRDVPRMGTGLSFTPNIIIDTHFEERNRMDRLSAAVGMSGGRIGIGIPEDCAVLISGDIIEVIGSGRATLVTSDGIKILNPGETLHIK